jgi:hypothetical protein
MPKEQKPLTLQRTRMKGDLSEGDFREAQKAANRMLIKPQDNYAPQTIKESIGTRKRIRETAQAAVLARIPFLCSVADSRSAPMRVRIDAITTLIRLGVRENDSILLPGQKIMNVVARVAAEFMSDDAFPIFLDRLKDELQDAT